MRSSHTTPLAQSTVSQHLKVLREAGLIRGEIEGPATCYCLIRPGLRWLKEQIEGWLPGLLCAGAGILSLEHTRKEESSKMKHDCCICGYFERVAGEWDTLPRRLLSARQVREAAIAQAYLRPEMTWPTWAAGTGFMAAGLAPLVSQVYVLDGSAAMLDVARRNLAALRQRKFRQTDGHILPLRPTPAWTRSSPTCTCTTAPTRWQRSGRWCACCKPGGRLAITDMDAHPHEWMQDGDGGRVAGLRPRPDARPGCAKSISSTCWWTARVECCASSQADASDAAKIDVFVAAGSKRVTGARRWCRPATVRSRAAR